MTQPGIPSIEQQRVLKFLKSPASYSHKPAEVRFIETHISWVFIASPFVFKVKKPVNLGFVDFSTLEKRHYFCRRELELNRRLCPEVYLAVMPIYESDAGFSFDDEDGEIAEYTLKMRELPHGWFLSELLAKGLVEETEINRVIACLRQFYTAQTPRPEIEAWGTPEKLKISTDENFAQVEAFAGKTISPVAFETIRHFTDCFYAANRATISRTNSAAPNTRLPWRSASRSRPYHSGSDEHFRLHRIQRPVPLHRCCERSRFSRDGF